MSEKSKRPANIFKKLRYFKVYRKIFRRSLVGDLIRDGLFWTTIVALGLIAIAVFLFILALQLWLVQHKTFMAIFTFVCAAIVLFASHKTGLSTTGKMDGYLTEADKEAMAAQREEERKHPERYR